MAKPLTTSTVVIDSKLSARRPTSALPMPIPVTTASSTGANAIPVSAALRREQGQHADVPPLRLGPPSGGGTSGPQWLLPTAREMTELVMPGIDAVKAGDREKGGNRLVAAAEALRKRGAAAVILGCTEIPVVLDASNSPLPVVDATASLARRAVERSRAQRGIA